MYLVLTNDSLPGAVFFYLLIYIVAQWICTKKIQSWNWNKKPIK